jgi:hypothetical protein
MAGIIAIAGQPGNLIPAVLTGATGGVFQSTLGGQLNLLLPGSLRLEQRKFTVRAAGFTTLPAGTFTATLVAALYAHANTGTNSADLWTAGSGNKIAASTSLSVTQAGTVAVTIPWEIEVGCEGDSVSGVLQGLMQDIVNNVKDSTNNGAVLTNGPTGVLFANEPPLQFAAGVALTNGGATATSNLNAENFYCSAD